MTHRRRFLKLASTAAAAAAVAPAAERKKIAAVITEYRPDSHADLRIGRLLNGYEFNGRKIEPRLHLVSMYTDQVPPTDMSRPLAAKHGFKICPTVAEALTLGTGKLAVDGVALIGEHGRYPDNEKGQKLYPRYELYKQVVDVFRQSGRSVPVFFDKHFSYDWTKAKWMYDQHRELGFPLMAGSGQPYAFRKPPLELDLDTPIERAVLYHYGPKESYGFHSLEMLQCMVERRKGGEIGLASVQCLEGPEVWRWTSQNAWASRLLDQAVARSGSRKPGSMQDLVKRPLVFLLQYRDGLQAAVYGLDGYLRDAGFAAAIPGKTEIPSTEFWSQPGRPWSHCSGHVYYMEQLLLTGRMPCAVERTLLTTGALAALMDSSYLGNKRIDTPHLAISYRARKDSLFNRGPVSPLAR
jgi:hypothetical protein